MQFLTYLALAGTAAALPMTSLSRRGGVHTGTMTYHLDFNSNACGVPANGMVAAISADAFDPFSPTGYQGGKNPNRNTLCGKQVSITHVKSGTVTTATIVDRKATGSADAIDVTQSVFTALGADMDAGSCQVTWSLP